MRKWRRSAFLLVAVALFFSVATSAYGTGGVDILYPDSSDYTNPTPWINDGLVAWQAPTTVTHYSIYVEDYDTREEYYSAEFVPDSTPGGGYLYVPNYSTIPANRELIVTFVGWQSTGTGYTIVGLDNHYAVIQ